MGDRGWSSHRHGTPRDGLPPATAQPRDGPLQGWNSPPGRVVPRAGGAPFRGTVDITRPNVASFPKIPRKKHPHVTSMPSRDGSHRPRISDDGAVSWREIANRPTCGYLVRFTGNFMHFATPIRTHSPKRCPNSAPKCRLVLEKSPRAGYSLHAMLAPFFSSPLHHGKNGLPPATPPRSAITARGCLLLIATLLVLASSGCGGDEGTSLGGDHTAQTSQALSIALGDGWFGTNLGASEALGGSSSFTNGVFTLAGGGGDLWGYQDDGHFVYRPIAGDFEFTARVSSYGGVTNGEWAKAAIIFKEASGGNEPSDQAAGVYQSLNYATDDYWYVRASGGYISAYNASTINATGQGALLRLTRTGNTFRSYHWNDAASTWVQHGGDRVVALNAQGYLGMAVTSSSSGSLMTATFTDVSFSGPAPDATAPAITNVAALGAGTSATITWDTDEPASGSVDYGASAAYGSSANHPGNVLQHSVTVSGLTENTSYHFRVTSLDASGNSSTSIDTTFDSGSLPPTALPAGWSSINLGGSQAMAGSSTHTAGVFTVTGGGGDLWSFQDDAHYVYQPVSGDFELIAQIDGYSGDTSYAYAKGALVFKEDDGSGIPNAQAGSIYQSLNYSGDDYWYVRGSTSISAYNSASLNSVGGGALLRLTRTGNTFRSYHWNDATSAWVQHGGDRVVALASNGFVGLAATSGTTAGLLSVQFSNVSIGGGSSGPDTTAPLVSNITVTEADTSATISWTTDEPATSVVEYGATSGYGNNNANQVLTTNHSITIFGLSASTLYHFRVSSADAANNQTAASDATFTTTAVPPPDVIISNVVVSDQTEHSALVSWTTNVPATSELDYDLDGWPKTVDDLTLKTNHSALLTRMMAGQAHDYQISANDGSGHSAATSVQALSTVAYASDALPAGWSSVDIGPVSAALPGSAFFDPNANGGSFIVRGTGTDVFNAQDSFHFVHYPVSGDFILTLKVEGWHGYLHQWSKAMTMFRVDLDDDSQMFNQSLNNRGHDWLYYRPVKGGNHIEITESQLNPGDGTAVWARLTRVGNTFTEEYSADGVNWQYHGPAAGTVVNLPAVGYVGFGVTSKSNDYLSEIVYSHVSVIDNSVPDTIAPVITNVAITTAGDTATITWNSDEAATSEVEYGTTVAYGSNVNDGSYVTDHSLVLTGLTPNTDYHLVVHSADVSGNSASGSDVSFNSGAIPNYQLPAAWSNIDLGNSSVLGGSASYNAGVFTISGSGGDLWGGQDDAHFVYQPVNGDFELIAQVDAYAGDTSYTYAKAALMFKEDDGSGIPSASTPGIYQSLNHSSEDYWYQRGAFSIESYSFATLNTTGGSALLRLTRTGNTFRSYHWDSAGQTWVQHGGDRTVALATAGFVGLAATSGTGNGILSVDFSGVSLSGGAPPVVDTSAPVITNVAVTPAGASATISWTTDEPATSDVAFGLTASHGSIASTAGLTTNHQVVLTGLNENTLYHFQVTSEDAATNAASGNDTVFDAGITPSTALPAGWFGIDLLPNNVGNSYYDGGQFVISGLGGDYWGNGDGGQLVYQQVSGDFDLQATVVSYAGDVSATYCKAVLLFKQQLGAATQPTSGAAGVFQSINYGAEDYWYQRDSDGGSITSYSSSSLNTFGGGVRVRLTRTGNTFRSYRWDNGSQSWMQIGSDRTVALNVAGFVGMGVTSTTGSLLEVTFGDVVLSTP